RPVRSAVCPMLSPPGWSVIRPGYRAGPELDLDLTLGSSVAAMTLRYRPLGRTGMPVSTYCLGTMMFASDGNADHDECACIMHAGLEPVHNFLDTADIYGAAGGETE